MRMLFAFLFLLALGCGCTIKQGTFCDSVLDSCASKCRNVVEVEKSTACYRACVDVFAKCRESER
jgi:hypothetical protein